MEEYQDGGQTRTKKGEPTMWTFEPSAALAVYNDFINKEGVELVTMEKLDREKGVEMSNGSIVSITMLSGKKYVGSVFIDATYEGDLMAAAGISYTTGREGNDQYGENLNGVQANDTSLTLLGTVSANGRISGWWSNAYQEGRTHYVDL